MEQMIVEFLTKALQPRKVICTFEIDHHGPGTHLACSPAVEAYVMPNGGLGFKMATL